MSIDSSEVSSGKSHRFGSPAGIITRVIFIFIISQLAGAFIVELFASLLNYYPASGSLLSDSAISQFFYILIAEGLTVAGVLWTLRRDGIGLKQIGLGRQPAWRDLGLAALGFVAFIAILVVVTALISGLWHGYNTNQLQDVGFKAVTRTSDKVLAFISLVILPPLGEETLMRGYLFSGLRKRWSFFAAGLMTCLLFGAAHLLTGASGLLWAAGVDTFILSWVLVYLRERTGALYAGMMVHALNNVLAFLVYFHS